MQDADTELNSRIHIVPHPKGREVASRPEGPLAPPICIDQKVNARPLDLGIERCEI